METLAQFQDQYVHKWSRVVVKLSTKVFSNCNHFIEVTFIEETSEKHCLEYANFHGNIGSIPRPNSSSSKA